MSTITRLLGVLSFALFVAGLLLRTFNLSWGYDTMLTGCMIFALGFSPLFLKNKLSEETRKDAKISYAVFFLSSVLLVIAAQLTILHLPGGSEVSLLGLLVFITYVVFFSRAQEGRKLRIRKDRQLAAMLFTDIVGFTQMMGTDEDAGLLAVEANRKIHKKWIRKHRGKWLKEMGDGTISIFYTVTEAMLCAIEIQKEIKRTQPFGIRMGIHISEIVFTDTDAFGDGMNLASRISNQAQAGEICFSEGVYQNIRNRENLAIESIGYTDLKNVDHPIQLYKINTFT
jgi:class 3 adenylate cyclase